MFKLIIFSVIMTGSGVSTQTESIQMNSETLCKKAAEQMTKNYEIPSRKYIPQHLVVVAECVRVS